MGLAGEARSRWWLLALGLCAACGSSSATSRQSAVEAGSAGAPASAPSALAGRSAAGGTAQGGSGADRQPTFSYIYGQLFRSCLIGPCHGGGVAGVDMSSRANAYASLVDRAPQPMGACESTGLIRVVPFQPDKSLLTAKLEIDAPCGQQMPIGGLLPAEDRALIRTWIMNGARDD